MLWGYFLKIVIVSRLEILTDYVYSDDAYAGIPMIVAMIAYSFQIYCDFAGYSSIAIGAARIMGFDIMRNFRQPYLAVSVVDFWRRWHISLSTWFRDYLYIPLGGNRVGTVRKYLNIMIVFLVSGIWHGANMTFVVWGALFGLYQILGYVMKPVKNKLNELSGIDKYPKIKKFLCVVWTYVIVSVTWIFFRSGTIAVAINDIGRTFKGIKLSNIYDGTLFGLGLGVMNFAFVIIAVLVLTILD